ncbi:hypothetical protein [Deinococcus knuensis]|nr:hypothetical protein [Deinococcus knuensis]
MRIRLLVLGCCLLLTDSIASGCELTPPEQRLWNRTVTPLLKSPLWQARDIYDAAHVLMQPLHFAFLSGDKKSQGEFNDFVERYMQSGASAESFATLNGTQFTYFLSQYLKLKSMYSAISSPDLKLKVSIENQVMKQWLNDPVKWYDGQHANRSERLRWRIETKDPKYNYYRLMPDEDMFLMAIASDLYATGASAKFKTFYSRDVAPLLRDALHEFLTQTPAGGVIFKPGILSDYPDTAWAGHLYKGTNIPKLPKPDVTIDSSHAHRYPLWLESFQAMGQVLPDQQGYLTDLHDRLVRQFFVMFRPSTTDSSVTRMTNYMDGWNGLYRWNYATTGQNAGYGPYELSGTLLLGWWGFLHDKKVTQAYAHLKNDFPLSEQALNLYVGPNTTRERHPLMSWPSAFTNGSMELLVHLAAKDCG